MMSDTLLMTLLVAVCALTYSFEIVFGLAGTVLMLPILGFFFDSKTLVVYSLLPQLLVAFIALAHSHRKLDLKLLFSMLGFAALGSILGGFFFAQIPLLIFQRMLAAVIMLAGLFLIVTPHFRLGCVGRRSLDFAAGVSHALFGISGPIVMTRLLGSLADKTVIRNNALCFFTGLNCIRAGYYFANGAITPQIQRMFIVSFICLPPVLLLSQRLHFRLNDALFRKAVAWVILLCGIAYLLK
jgi:uncharacterized membrane protein YfcA